LKAYIGEWRTFFDQCDYLPKPFNQVEISLNNNQTSNTPPKKHKNDESDVRKVGHRLQSLFFWISEANDALFLLNSNALTSYSFQLMLDSWNNQIFSNIKGRLQGSAMKLVRAERNGEAFDSLLVIGVRESYGRPFNS